MAKRRRKNSKKQPEYPGWLWGLFGLAVGLSVAAAVWFSDRRAAVPEPEMARPTSLETALDDNGEMLSRSAETETPSEPEERRFEFYELLPNMELVVPEEGYEIETDTEPQAVVEPGTYVLQAGSFTALGDAERRRAELGLQGIQSYIQRVIIDDNTYHRVRIGPIDDLDELNMLRSRLRAARIDVLRIRLGD